MKFRKKPVVIEAVQLTKELRNNMGPFPEWALPHLEASRTEKIENSEEIYINNLSGKLHVFDGDWIIRGTKEGDVYPCPDDVFKSTYEKECTAEGEEPARFNFSRALRILKEGKKVAREGWNGKGMYIQYVLGKDHEHAIIEPFLVIKNVKNSFNTWVPSISDLLAEDWSVVK